MEETILNKDQKCALELVNNGDSLFITGMGGTGKSTLLRHIINLKKEQKQNIGITSTTGISADLINGKTLHSFLGIGLGKENIDALFKKICIFKKYEMLKNLDLLIIDEISMLNIELFEKIDLLFKRIRRNSRFFGGLQVILSGDFLQLPPVLCDKFIFSSKLWNDLNFKTIYLQEIVRQSELQFVRILKDIRIQNITEDVKNFLESREIDYPEENCIIPTMLYSTNYQVSKKNKECYNLLNTEEHQFNLEIKYKKYIKNKEKYTNLIRFEQNLHLKKGAQVMFLINKDPFFNGSRGIITDFIGGYPEVLFNNGQKMIVTKETLDIVENDSVVLSYTQIPLKLAYAISIHKSQGSTIELAVLDCKNIFEKGQFYVAISRVKNVSGLYIKNLDVNLIKADPEAKEYYLNLI